MAGLLAGHMLRRHLPQIVEAQASLPNNHAALLRFRTEKVSRETGIPFKAVRVRKAIWDARADRLRTEATLADNNEYSLKVTGEAMDRSVLSMDAADRFIAPGDFISTMSRGMEIAYNTPFGLNGEFELTSYEDPIISTIPMPVLMKMANWPNRPDFRWRPIWTLTTYITMPMVRLYQTIYYPDASRSYYRASFTGNRLSIEFTVAPPEVMCETYIAIVLEHFGLRNVSPPLAYEVKRQEYGKLIPIPEDERKQFILAMSDKYNIWSVGRFATWRQILLDDVVDDIRFVDSFITRRDHYHRRLHSHIS